MPKEDFKREQEVLRLLWLEGGGYTRQQFAEALDLSPDSVDRSLREFRRALGEAAYLTDAWNSRSHVYQYVQPDLQRVENVLVKLYSLRTLRKEEGERYLSLLVALCQRDRSFTELVDTVSQAEWSEWKVDHKAVRQYLVQLIRAGLIKREPGHRGKYVLEQALAKHLQVDQLSQLLDYVVFCAGTSAFSVLGYRLVDNLSRWLNKQGWTPQPILRFKYAYFARVLDEQMAYQLLASIQNRCFVELRYFTKQARRRYEAQTVHRRNEKVTAERLTVYPLQVVYDHEYGRWYLLGKELDKSYISRFRAENIQRVALLPDTLPAAEQQSLLVQAQDELKSIWGVGRDSAITVKAKFYKPDSPSSDFIHDRVKHEGRWGQIIDENEEWFLWQIEIADLHGIRPWLRSFGSSVEVLEPLDLRQAMIEEWTKLVDLYG